ncbi:MAG: NAD(P)-binding domain-containing protein [Pseudomonadales bacterium]|nr:NAD(P)-binding domain-containing protein [Pseudomonadales bacterium]
MRYIIYGAGAIGGAIGARLHLAGKEVVLIARGQHLQAIRESGLRYRSPVMDEYLRITAVASPEEIAFCADDCVILTMKSQHTEDALRTLASFAPPDLPVICAQNGLANEAMAARRFRRVYAMVVVLPATHLVPGEVIHHSPAPEGGSAGILDAGCYGGGTDRCIRQVASDLTAAGFTCKPQEEPMRWKYAKLLQNLGNALQAVCAEDNDTRQIMRMMRAEALACYAAAGYDCPDAKETAANNVGLTMGEVTGTHRGGGSSWQSLQRGKTDIEADWLNGEICLLGTEHGIATPANEVIRYLANQAALQGDAPGRYAAAEVLGMIERLASNVH